MNDSIFYLLRVNSQFHKYWDINTILICLARYTTMDLKLNEQDVLYVQTFSFNLRVFTSKSGEWCRNYNRFYMCLPLFKGPKVMGQTNNHKSNYHFLILGCKSFAVNYSLKSGMHRHHRRWVSSLVMLCQASTATVFSSCLFLGHFPFQFCLQQVKCMLNRIQVR